MSFFSLANGPTPSMWKLRRLSRKQWSGSLHLQAGIYKLFEFVGDPNAERVVVMMGSACETAEETVACALQAW